MDCRTDAQFSSPSEESRSSELLQLCNDVLQRNTFSEYSRFFAQHECSKSMEFYRSRINAIGFKDYESVLDAACGIGQWAIALAETNNQVIGLDMSEERVRFAAALLEAAGKNNARFDVGSIETLPYADGTFDGIVCAGAWMYTQPERTLSEFVRVLKPHGKLYVQCNGAGWSLRAIIRRGLLGYDRQTVNSLGGRWVVIRQHAHILRSSAMAQLRGKPSYGGNVFFTERQVRKLFDQHGLDVLQVAGDGDIGGARNAVLSKDAKEAFYPKTFLGCWCVFEILAEKRSA